MALMMARPWQHPKTGVYWLRKRVPDDLRPILGKAEVKQSLKTKDPAEAKRQHALALAALDEQWVGLRAGPRMLSEMEAHQLVAPAYESWIARWRDNPSEQREWHTDFYPRLWNMRPATGLFGLSVAEMLTKVEEAYPAPALAMEALCRQEAAELIARKGLRIDETGRVRLEKAIGAALQRASLVLEKMARGEPEPTHPATWAERPTDSGSTRLPFETVVDGWAAERKPAAKTLYEYKRVIRDLTTFLEIDDAHALTAQQVVRWKAHLVAADLHAKTIRDAKLAPLRAILQWAVDNHHLAANPAARITMDVKRQAGEGRRGFTDDEAALILHAASQQKDAAKRWIPLLGAYSGARIAELAQLRREDIVRVDGIPAMKITGEAGRLKTASSERLVPLHPAIIEAQFLEFVETRPPGPLFPNLQPDKFGSRGGNGTKILGRWIRGLGIADERISPNHSWRHRFKTLGRKHGLSVDISDAITGHAGKTVADRYGEFPVEALYREMSKIPALPLTDRQASSSRYATEE